MNFIKLARRNLKLKKKKSSYLMYSRHGPSFDLSIMFLVFSFVR